jgi:hypothetical protein
MPDAYFLEEVRGQIGIPSIAIIIAMLEDISVVEQAVGLIVALARIGTSTSHLCRSTLTIFGTDGIRDAILTPDTIKKVYRMLEHKAQSVRQSGLYLMATLAQDGTYFFVTTAFIWGAELPTAELRAQIATSCTPESLVQITLNDTSTELRQSAVQDFVALARYGRVVLILIECHAELYQLTCGP